MGDDLNDRLDQIEKDLKESAPNPEEVPKPEKVKKVAKAKKVAKKGEEAEAKKSRKGKKEANGSENLVHLADLASEAKITTQSARKKLRVAEIERTGRWAWEEGSKALKDARKALGLE